MSKNIYTDIKDIFSDSDISGYVSLDKTVIAYRKICGALDKPVKIILFFGAPGTGKTFLLQRIYNDLKDKKPIIFFLQPFFSEKDFINAISTRLFGDGVLCDNTEALIQKCEKENPLDPKTNMPKTQYVLILDESQLYPKDLVEKIRLIADTRYFKILFTVHKTASEDLLAKECFNTRIGEIVEFDFCSYDEMLMYIEKKLFLHEQNAAMSIFTNKTLKLLYKISKGNLRRLNQILYKVFEIAEYYEENSPATLKKELKNCILMAALDLGILHA